MTSPFPNPKPGLALVAALASLAISACAGEAVVPSASVAADGTSQELLAASLSRAEDAAKRGDPDALEAAMQTIERLGAQPLNDEAQTAMSEWQALRPGDAIPVRGRTLGPGFRSGTIGGGKQTELAQTFLSGQRASIAVSSPTSKALDLKVIDAKDALVCETTRRLTTCDFIPIFTQRHTIYLRNNGQDSARYYLVIE